MSMIQGSTSPTVGEILLPTAQKSDRALPVLWVSDQTAGECLNSFPIATPADSAIARASQSKHHVLCFDANTPEQVYHQLAIALSNAGCRVEVVPLDNRLEDFIFGVGNNAPLMLLTVAKPYLEWSKALEDSPLSLEQGLELAKFWKQSTLTELKISVRLEALRKRTNVSPYDWNRYIRQLEAEIHAAVDGVDKPTNPKERLKLELKALLKETDPIERMMLKSQIASHYRLKKDEIEQLLKHLDERSKSKESRLMGLDELFNLPQVGIEYVIPGMLPVGETALLVANPKAGKSLLAYDAAFAVATGEASFLGEQVKQGKVLIIQCDESVNTARGRLFKRGFRHEDAANVQFVDSFTISQLDLLEEWLESFRPTLVIVDSLRRISAGRQLSENSAEFADAVYQLKELIARYNAAAILIHHTNKNQEAVGVERVRGSSAIAGAVWGVWELGHILKPDPNNKKRMIVDPKDPTRLLNITARDVEGQRLRIELDPENNHWLTLGEEGVEATEINERKTHEHKILELLKPIAPTGLEASEINAHLNIGRGIYNCLHRLLAKGVIGSRPSAKDRRRTVYYYPKNDQGDTPPSLSPTPTDRNVIEYAETLTQYELENRSQIDHKIDHKSITKNAFTPPIDTSKQEQVSASEVDHKNRSQGGECVSVKPVINSLTRPSGDSQWNPGDKFCSISQHKSYKKYLGKVLVVRQDNPTRLTVCAEGTRDEFCYHSIERVLDTP